MVIFQVYGELIAPSGVLGATLGIIYKTTLRIYIQSAYLWVTLVFEGLLFIIKWNNLPKVTSFLIFIIFKFKLWNKTFPQVIEIVKRHHFHHSDEKKLVGKISWIFAEYHTTSAKYKLSLGWNSLFPPNFSMSIIPSQWQVVYVNTGIITIPNKLRSGGKWFIHSTEHFNEKQLLSKKHSHKLSLVKNTNLKHKEEVQGYRFDPIATGIFYPARLAVPALYVKFRNINDDIPYRICTVMMNNGYHIPGPWFNIDVILPVKKSLYPVDLAISVNSLPPL